ncbi:MAG TPA: hypothetical protein VFC95_00295 [Guyparkeria sp.]|nr:hypothetical protein [Guyparkeria sp.]
MPNSSINRLFPTGQVTNWATDRATGLTLLVLLALSMLATRYHHFSSVLHLADTSWAVFFLAGLWFRSTRVLFGLLAVAVLVDLGSVALDGAAMASCFSPAYPGVLLAYAALWGAGRLAGKWLAAPPSATLIGIGGIALALTVGAAAAFIISNVTFYAFSGQFETMTAGEYTAVVAPYLLGYLSTAAGYTTLALVALAAFQRLRESNWRHRHS